MSRGFAPSGFPSSSSFHLWPNRLGGGYIGVDIFFVISGFLITSHLVAHPPRNARGLAEFWGRRIRRLLPASLPPPCMC